MSAHATALASSRPVRLHARALLTEFICLLKPKPKKNMSAQATAQPVSRRASALMAKFTDLVAEAVVTAEEAEEAAAAAEGAEEEVAADIRHFVTAEKVGGAEPPLRE